MYTGICGFEFNFSTTIGWLAIQFGADIYGAQKIIPSDFADPLTSHQVPSSGQTFQFVQYFGFTKTTL